MSSDLQWLLLRNNNTFLVRRGPKAAPFPLNPEIFATSTLSSVRVSQNSKTIDIKDSGSGIQITTRKSKASPPAVRAARTALTICNRSGLWRALGVTAGLTKQGHRPDLRTVSRDSLGGQWTHLQGSCHAVRVLEVWPPYASFVSTDCPKASCLLTLMPVSAADHEQAYGPTRSRR